MTGVMDIDDRALTEAFGSAPMAVRHGLAGHPLLSLEAIAVLADRLPPSSAERHRADLPEVMPGGAPDIQGTPSETVRGIESNGCWMVLWNVEDVPEYRALLDQCLDEVESIARVPHGSLRNRQAFVFLTAPNGVTPVHFDPEHNFLLQVRGLKEMNVGAFADPRTLDAELRRYYAGGHRNLEVKPSAVTTFRMLPGDGTYVYPFAPHFVRNGPEVSISLSITFRTGESERFEMAHRFNAKLRRVPVPLGRPGRWVPIDRAKASLVTWSDRRNRRVLGRRERTAAASQH